MHELDPHRRASRLGEIILGGQDGLVNVLGVILGVAAASQSQRLVVAAGLAAAIAESISMAAVAYTASRAEHARYESERAREYRHIAAIPQIESDEVREIYRGKGFTGELLDRIVDTITSNPDVWVNVMLAEELNLSRPGPPLTTSLVVGGSALVGSFIPLVPFFWFGSATAIPISVAVSAAALFAVGAYKSFALVGNWLRSGAEMVAIGLASAFAGYGIGLLFRD